MATLTLEIGRKGKSGKRAITFLVCHKKTKKRIPTELSATDADISRNGKSIKNPNLAMKVEMIRRDLQDAMDELAREIIGREDITADFIVQRITNTKSGLPDFFTFAEKWIARCNLASSSLYAATLSALRKFTQKARLPFDDITYELLTDFEQYLSNRPSAQSRYLFNISHLIHEAQRQYNVDPVHPVIFDPFLRFKRKPAPKRTGVRALTLDELMQVVNYKPVLLSEKLARDCFVLSFCLMGMNAKDMYEATRLEAGYIKYCRAKTRDRRADNAYIETRVHPYIEPLMTAYRGKNHVFNFAEKYKSADDFRRSLAFGVNNLKEHLGIHHLTFYSARHTFASLSRNLMRFAKSDVDEALNHVGSYDIADVYIVKDFSIINDNNFKLLNKVFGRRQFRL